MIKKILLISVITSSLFSLDKFVPDISLIVDSSYVNRDIPQDEFEDHPNGFNLNYAELALSSNVDANFRLDGIFHFSTEEVEIEEAYFSTTNLDYGLAIKGGKFKSSFGYLNSRHRHKWSFDSAPLIYSSYTGPEGINNSGLQVNITLPLPQYLMIGAEALNGEEDKEQYLAYTKLGFDIGDTAVLSGLSTLYEKQDTNESKLYGFDLVVSYYIDSYSYVKFQGELMKKTSNITDDSTGFYTQFIYAPNNTWAMGMRYEAFIQGQDTQKYTAMCEYKTSEYARFRLNYSHNDNFIDVNNDSVKLNTLILSANIAIGAHGAHEF